MTARRRKTPPKSSTGTPPLQPHPDKIMFQWGDGPVSQLERPPPPFTGMTFWEACQKYFPPGLHTAAAAYLFELSAKAQSGKKRGKVGIGQQVQDLMTGPLKLKQEMARKVVAGRLCKCRDKDGSYVEPCKCGAYERVAITHRQWRSDQQKDKP